MRDRLGEKLKQKLWADYQPDEEAVDEPQDGQVPSLSSKLAQWVGGVVSLTLVLGAIYWIFELGRRDANEVPVIQAMGGVARDLPENAGGPLVGNQGLQVNEVLGNDNTAPVEPETRLAPPPQRVEAQDVVPAPAPETPVAPVADTPAPPPSTPPSIPALTQPEADPNMTRPERRLQSAALSPNADLLSEAIANAISTVAAEEAGDAADTPAAPTPTAPAATAPSPAPDPVLTPAAGSPFAGEVMIQLGAYDDEESANRDYDALLVDNQDLLGSLTRFVERREAGGRVFYRLRARGFADIGAASDMCTALLARSVQCIAVTAR